MGSHHHTAGSTAPRYVRWLRVGGAQRAEDGPSACRSASPTSAVTYRGVPSTRIMTLYAGLSRRIELRLHGNGGERLQQMGDEPTPGGAASLVAVITPALTISIRRRHVGRASRLMVRPGCRRRQPRKVGSVIRSVGLAMVLFVGVSRRSSFLVVRGGDLLVE